MIRNLLLALAAVLPAAPVRAQDPAELGKFISDFEQALQVKDDKLIDKAVRQRPAKAIEYYQEIRVRVWSGHKEHQPKLDALRASWPRVFEKSTTLDQLEHWVESQDQKSYEAYTKYRSNVIKAWASYQEAAQEPKRSEIERARDTLMEVARQVETTGHKIEAAETWLLVAVCLSKIPEKTVNDRRDAVFALEQFVALRQAWDWTKDGSYSSNSQFLKAEKLNIERDEKAGEKRKAEGYGDNVRGVEALVMPKTVEELHELQFQVQPGWDTELDYCQKGGPVPPFWWVVGFDKEKKSEKLNWFRRLDLHLVRVATNKFAVSLNPAEPKLNQEVEVGGKGKATQFYLDAEKKIPYAMFFWTGSDKEHIGEAEINLAPADTNTPIYFRSAAGWTTTIGNEAVTVYDDNTNGQPMDGDPMEGKFPMRTLGAEKTEVPLLDSMRIGKGPRLPFSEFAFIGGAWRWIHRDKDGKLGTKPLNPDFVKTGKVKLVWTGPKPSAPVQLVIRGRGDYASAMFDVASGKEVEVPTAEDPPAEYQVLWGRIVQGKGSRVQMGTIYTGDAKPFAVAAGKTFELKMGAPFSIGFERGGSETEVKIDGSRIVARESSGCLVTELQGMGLVPEVLAAKEADGKGAKVIGKFVKLTDPEFINAAAKKYGEIGLMLACFPMPDGAKDGSMEFKQKLPGSGWKVGLQMKKHPLFGEIKPVFQ